MTAIRTNLSAREGRNLIEDAIREYGAIRVLISAAVAVLRRRPAPRPRPPDVADLSAHLRRDVGLWNEPEAVDWRHFR